MLICFNQEKVSGFFQESLLLVKESFLYMSSAMCTLLSSYRCSMTILCSDEEFISANDHSIDVGRPVGKCRFLSKDFGFLVRVPCPS